MLFMHNEINFKDLANNNGSFKKELNKIDSNILYLEFKEINGEYKTKIVNLTDGVTDGSSFNLKKFNSNIELADKDFLLDLKELVEENHKSTMGDLTSILKSIDKASILGSSFYAGKDSIGNNAVGGVKGYGTQTLIFSYIKFDKDFEFKKILNIAPTLKKYKEAYKKDKKFEFNANIVFDNELFLKTIENIDKIELSELTSLSLKNNKLNLAEAPTLIICNISGLRDKYIVRDEVKNIKAYFEEVINDSSIFHENCTCRNCNKQFDKLNKESKFEYYKEYIDLKSDAKEMNRFNLDDVSSSREDDSLIICKNCKDIIEANNTILGKYKFVLLKDIIRNEQVTKDILKHTYKNIVELLNSEVNNSGYLYRIEKGNGDIYNIVYDLDLTSKNKLTSKEISRNYLTINMFLGRIGSISEKQQYISRYSFLFNHYIEDAKKRDLLVDQFFKHHLDYYLNGTKLPLYVFNSFLKRVDMDFRFFKKNYFDLYIKLTKEGEQNMNIKTDLNIKLSQIEKGETQLSLTDEELIVLTGRLVSYLNNKSKKSEKSLTYLNLGSYGTLQLKRILENYLLKYGHEISANQSKFKMAISYALSNLGNSKLKKTELKTLFLVGALANAKEIELTQTKGKENE